MDKQFSMSKLECLF